MYWVNWNNDALMWESKCGNYSSSGDDALFTDYRPPGDTWVRYTEHYDFTAGHFTV
jgi:hypothetical protein